MRIAGFRSRGLGGDDPEPEPQPIGAVLFDFSNTLFHALDSADWLREGAAAAGACLDDAAVTRLVGELEQAWELPEVVAAQQGRDLSPDAHRTAGLTWLRAVTDLAPLAEELYGQLTSARCWIPYDDTGPVLAELHRRGVPVGVVSDIAWDIRPIFAHHDLGDLVGAFALSYEHGLCKPDPKLFLSACADLDVEPGRTLMVGDNPGSDGGAAWLGIRSYILPVEGALARRRGLETVLRMVDG